MSENENGNETNEIERENECGETDQNLRALPVCGGLRGAHHAAEDLLRIAAPEPDPREGVDRHAADAVIISNLSDNLSKSQATFDCCELT